MNALSPRVYEWYLYLWSLRALRVKGFRGLRNPPAPRGALDMNGEVRQSERRSRLNAEAAQKGPDIHMVNSRSSTKGSRYPYEGENN